MALRVPRRPSRQPARRTDEPFGRGLLLSSAPGGSDRISPVASFFPRVGVVGARGENPTNSFWFRPSADEQMRPSLGSAVEDGRPRPARTRANCLKKSHPGCRGEARKSVLLSLVL